MLLPLVGWLSHDGALERDHLYSNIDDHVPLPCDGDRAGGEAHEPVGGFHPVSCTIDNLLVLMIHLVRLLTHRETVCLSNRKWH